MDPLVIDIPFVWRALLVYGAILPRRPRESAAAYRQIWTERGSPLRFHGEDLAEALEARLDRPVALGMRYGNPSLSAGLADLQARGAARVSALPLFPQYSESAWETAARATRKAAAALGIAVDVLPPFYQDPGFLRACAASVEACRAEFAADLVLFSFHGVPERHVRRTDPSGSHCLATDTCCEAIVEENSKCYRAQCFATARGLVKELGLPRGSWDVAFQSRLGRTPWIRPYTDERLVELAKTHRRVLVSCPSFVADCLETIEEIGLRARETFRAAGGEDLRLVPSLNSSAPWVDAVEEMVR